MRRKRMRMTMQNKKRVRTALVCGRSRRQDSGLSTQRERERERERETDRQTDRHKQTDGQTDGETDRQRQTPELQLLRLRCLAPSRPA